MTNSAEILAKRDPPEKLGLMHQKAKENLINTLYDEAQAQLTASYSISESQTSQRSQAVFFSSRDFNGVISIVTTSPADVKKGGLLLSLDFRNPQDEPMKINLQLGGDRQTAKGNREKLLSEYTATQLVLLIDLVRSANPSSPDEYNRYFR